MVVVVPNSGKVIENLPFDEYLKLPEKNQSYLKTMIQKSPLHAELADSTETSSMAFGTMAHSVFFGEVNPARDWRAFDGRRAGKAWTDFKEQCETDGKEAVKQSDFDAVTAMGKMVPDSIRKIVDGAQKELTITFEIMNVDTGQVVKCKARIDIWTGSVIYDFKTTAAGVSKRDFAKSIGKYFYDLQAVWYKMAIQAAFGIDAPYYWIAQESSKPYDMNVFKASSELLANGADWLNNGMEIYCKCLDSNSFPGHYSGVAELIESPQWHMFEMDLDTDGITETNEI
jgi:hypothetical protein